MGTNSYELGVAFEVSFRKCENQYGVNVWIGPGYEPFTVCCEKENENIDAMC